MHPWIAFFQEFQIILHNNEITPSVASVKLSDKGIIFIQQSWILWVPWNKSYYKILFSLISSPFSSMSCAETNLSSNSSLTLLIKQI